MQKKIIRMCSMASQLGARTWPVVPHTDMHDFITSCMTSVGARLAHAQTLADVLVMADMRGHYSHGLNRLDMYVRDVSSGTTSVMEEEPVVLNERVATAWVDGRNLLGPVVGKFCIDLAIKKAKEAGIGMVVAKASNHFGIAGWYGLRAAEQDLVGIAFCNTSPLVFPTRASQAALGTNPIAFVAPGEGGDSLDLDMATSTVAFGKVELQQLKGEALPPSWGCDGKGRQTAKPDTVLSGGGLLPLGGTEESGGYKGSGLALMVEVLCGVMADSHYGPNIRSWQTSDVEANLGQCFIAIDTSGLAPGFAGRLSDLLNTFRSLPRSSEDYPVLVAGDPERQHLQVCEERGGIPYHPNQIRFIQEMAAKLDIAPAVPRDSTN